MHDDAGARNFHGHQELFSAPDTGSIAGTLHPSPLPVPRAVFAFMCVHIVRPDQLSRRDDECVTGIARWPSRNCRMSSRRHRLPRAFFAKKLGNRVFSRVHRTMGFGHRKPVSQLISLTQASRNNEGSIPTRIIKFAISRVDC